MIGPKSVSLCMIVCNQADLAKRAIESVTFADEVIIVDQGSSFEESEKLKKLATTYIKTTKKGNADYDRQFCYNLAKKDFIIALDSDEYFKPEDVEILTKHITEFDAEVVWFLFHNEISSNGITINLQDVLGDDPHPRFWKKAVQINGQFGPTVIWPHEAHQFPQINTTKVIYLNGYIQHCRQLEDVINTHLARGKNINPQAQQIERQFVQAVLKKFGNEVVDNVKLKFPELNSYLKGTNNG